MSCATSHHVFVYGGVFRDGYGRESAKLKQLKLSNFRAKRINAERCTTFSIHDLAIRFNPLMAAINPSQVLVIRSAAISGVVFDAQSRHVIAYPSFKHTNLSLLHL